MQPLVMVVLPDYGGPQHKVIGPFNTNEEAQEWGRLNVGSERAWFACSVADPSQYVAPTT